MFILVIFVSTFGLVINHIAVHQILIKYTYGEDKMPAWNGDPDLMPDLMEILLTLKTYPMGSNPKYQPCASTSIIKRMLQFIPLKPTL